LLSLAEIGPAVYGAWRLVLFDPNGMHYFDRSLHGFWRSFRLAIWLAMPSFLTDAIFLSHMKVTGGWSSLGTADWLCIAAAEIIGYVIAWTAFPLAVYYLTRFIDRGDRYLGYIVADNWAGVIEAPLYLVAIVIAYAGIFPMGWAQLFPLVARVMVLVYEGYIARTALNISWLGALGMVLVGLFIGELINVATDSMMQLG
jgi:hypothetical protein